MNDWLKTGWRRKAIIRLSFWIGFQHWGPHTYLLTAPDSWDHLFLNWLYPSDGTLGKLIFAARPDLQRKN